MSRTCQRQSRIDAPGALHHIIARGIHRRKIFDDQDRHDFVENPGLILDVTDGQYQPQIWRSMSYPCVAVSKSVFRRAAIAKKEGFEPI
ncbi:MAG TPA: hypothetical protein ENH37_10780 [Deltaproteobacteria bacterium]|nr:hypothetical protein [Deltaproteobacteria bacterium]